jgi:subtilisin
VAGRWVFGKVNGLVGELPGFGDRPLRYRYDEDPRPASRGAVSARYTDRHLILLPQGVGSAACASFRNLADIRLAASSDWDGTAPGIAAGEGVLFERLGAALVRGDPDQVNALTEPGRRHSLWMQPEREWRDCRQPARPWGAACLPGAPWSDTAEATWGLQVTGVLTSRYSGDAVRVALLDTGLHLEHPDFIGRRVVTRSFVTGLSTADVNGHGTFCAGVACGPRQPREGPRYGVAFGAELYVARVLDDDAGGTDGAVLAGIEWAVRSGCAVISMSLGSPVAVEDSHAQLYEAVAARALAAGSLLLAPAGNESQRPDLIAPVQQPANCPSILAVGAVDRDLAVAPFSNGNRFGAGGSVDLVAPGIAIHSASSGTGRYQTGSGTSMATPFVAGIAALLAEARPAARGVALKDLLLRACLARGAAARDVGAGVVRAPG